MVRVQGIQSTGVGRNGIGTKLWPRHADAKHQPIKGKGDERWFIAGLAMVRRTDVTLGYAPCRR